MRRIDFSWKSIRRLMFSLFLLAAGVVAASAADLIENVGEGRVNWSLGLVTANGTGAPPKDIKNPSQVRAMTQRAAIIVARRNLLEVLKEVRIDSATKVENLILSSDMNKTQVSGILQGSQVMQTKYFSGGSIEVTVGVYLRGELASALMPASLFLLTPALPALPGPSKPLEKPVPEALPVQKEAAALSAKESTQETAAVTSLSAAAKAEKEGKAEELIKAEATDSLPVEKRAGEPAVRTETTRQPAAEKGAEGSTPVTARSLPSPSSGSSEVVRSEPSPAVEQKEEKGTSGPPAAPAAASIVATGLVIDGRGLGLKPALLPRIINEVGTEIYSTRQVSRQSALEQGLVGYAKDVSAAQRNIRVTDKPLLVKGIKAAGKEKTDVVIADPDAAAVLTAVAPFNFLEKSRVIIVYD
jgi:hypothetical protein